MILTITPLKAFQDNYIWVIQSPQSNKVIVVDPGESAPVIAHLESKQQLLGGIFVTHHHFDHTGGLEALQKAYDIPIYGPYSDKGSRLEALISKPLKACDTIWIDFLETKFSILEIPGHTLDHLAFYGDSKCFCGDTLFRAGCGRVFEGTYAQLFESLAQITSLPKDTVLYPAHEYTQKNLEFALSLKPDNLILTQTLQAVIAVRSKGLPTLPCSLKEELTINPFLQAKTLSEFIHIRRKKDVF